MRIKVRQINDEDNHSLINKSVHDRNSAIKIVFELELNEKIHLENRVDAKSSTVTDIVIDDDFVIESAKEVHSDGAKLAFAKYIGEDELKLLIKSLVKK